MITEITNQQTQSEQGIIFKEVSGDNNQISGKWFNPHTGETILVRNSMDTPNGVQIMTNIGIIDAQTFSQFIKAEDESSIPIQQPSQSNNIFGEEIINELNNAKSESTNKQIIKSEQINTQQNKFDNNYNILKKLFDKQKTQPIINLEIAWDNFPKNEINTFINILDISKEDIATYIIENYLDTYHIIGAVSNFLDKTIEK